MLRITRATIEEHAVTVAFDGWSRDNYVVLPGACYAGNQQVTIDVQADGCT